MLTEDQFISYFEKLAIAHRTIAHNLDGQQSFFEVEDPDELNAFNEALRYATGSTVMLVVAGEGELDDNNSENHVQVMEFQIYILQKKDDGIKTSDIRSVCIEVIKSIVGRTKQDCRKGKIVPSKAITFRISNVPIRMVGPVELNWYGYTTQLSFTCPFGWSVDSGTWSDIP